MVKGLFILYEQASGYALFEVAEFDEVAQLNTEIQVRAVIDTPAHDVLCKAYASCVLSTPPALLFVRAFTNVFGVSLS